MSLPLILNLQTQPCLTSQAQSPKSAPFKAATRSYATRNTVLSASTQNCDSLIARRSANYHPNIWDFEFVQSLSSKYTELKYVALRNGLKEKVKDQFYDMDMGSLKQLELIDVLQKMGIGYHFQKEILASLDTVIAKSKSFVTEENLHATSLSFRLLRQHGYQVSQDIFLGFVDENGNFNPNLSDDIKGLLSLFEASHLSVEGESIMEEAKLFSRTHLENIRNPIPPKLDIQVSHALELPLHWRMLRLDARWHIESDITSDDNTASDLIQLAKIDFNILQATYQNDLKEISRWWVELGLGSHAQLGFARDRLMENFLWTIGVDFYPQNSYSRKGSTKVNALITILDDVYDVYGSLEELVLFTEAVERWDINAIEELPYYMKILFLALYNTVNEIGYVTLKEQGFNITRYLRKLWTDLCKAYLVEAKWYYKRYTPTLEEYLSNAWVSISGPVILFHAYFLSKHVITKEALQSIEVYPDIICWSSMILRLANDLGTSPAELGRGDVPKSIQCYMHEKGCSEESARKHIRYLISETWKKMNKDRIDDSIFPQPFLEVAVNLSRMAQCMYQYGDGHGIQDRGTKDRVISMLVEPITLVMDYSLN
ncbi:hypothetical protein ACHQM5_015181 [Ranunculus cassubicifolius]